MQSQQIETTEMIGGVQIHCFHPFCLQTKLLTKNKKIFKKCSGCPLKICCTVNKSNPNMTNLEQTISLSDLVYLTITH